MHDMCLRYITHPFLLQVPVPTIRVWFANYAICIILYFMQPYPVDDSSQKDTLVKKYSLMSLQSGGMACVTSLRSHIKNGKVLWKNSVSSRGATMLPRSLFERSLIR